MCNLMATAAISVLLLSVPMQYKCTAYIMSYTHEVNSRDILYIKHNYSIVSSYKWTWRAALSNNDANLPGRTVANDYYFQLFAGCIFLRVRHNNETAYKIIQTERNTSEISSQNTHCFVFISDCISTSGESDRLSVSKSVVICFDLEAGTLSRQIRGVFTTVCSYICEIKLNNKTKRCCN